MEIIKNIWQQQHTRWYSGKLNYIVSGFLNLIQYQLYTDYGKLRMHIIILVATKKDEKIAKIRRIKME